MSLVAVLSKYLNWQHERPIVVSDFVPCNIVWLSSVEMCGRVVNANEYVGLHEIIYSHIQVILCGVPSSYVFHSNDLCDICNISDRVVSASEYHVVCESNVRDLQNENKRER